MAVMNNMREYTKSILVILVLAFIGTIIFDWGMDITGLKSKPGIIGKVEGVEITALQFDRAFSNQLQAYRDQTGTDPAENQIDLIRNQVWEGMVQEILLQKAILKKGLTTTDEEVLWSVRNAPPEIIKRDPSYQNDQRQFDMAKWQSALNNPSYPDQYWLQVEEYLRQFLPREKLHQRLQASVRVTKDEIKREYLKQNQTVNVNYIFIDPKRFGADKIEINDEMIESYYDKNESEFQEEEKRKIQYVVFPTTPTAKDSNDTREHAIDLLKQAKAGEDFAELAQVYSADQSNKDKGGDLGFFGKGTMVKQFEDAAFAAKPGEIVGPVQTQFGLHIIRIEEKRTQNGKEEVKARHILLKYEASRKTLDKARDDADYFSQEANEVPFEELSQREGTALQTSTFFAKGSGFIPGIGLNKRASNFIFSSGAGAVSDIVTTPQGLVVFKIIAIQNERIKPLSGVSSTIRNKLKLEQQMTLAGKLAHEIYQRTTVGLSLQEVARQDSLEIKESGNFSRSGYVTGVGRDPRFIGAAFSLKEQGDITKPVEATRGFYLLELVEKKDFDDADFNNSKDRIATQLRQTKENQVFVQWYTQEKSAADIEDFRSKFF